MKHINLIIIILFFVSCGDQEENKAKPAITNLDEVIKYDFSSEIKRRNENIKSDHGNHDAAIQYANIGKYFSASEVYDRAFEADSNTTVFFDSSNFNFLPAIEYIIKEASKNQIVIINEAHHVSYHRFFTMLLLKKLREQGYNYFGAETLFLWDSSLNKKNYPTLNTGYYTVEPQYGNLIRQAFKNGFEVFAYEPNAITTGGQREIEQARNIEKILKKDPKAKIIIHCGYDHLLEGNVEDWGKAMAGRLMEYTGIDPLTIDQVELTEHSDKKYENPYYDKMKFNDFIVPKNNGKMLPVSFRPDGQQIDIFVFHPRTRLKYNRPHWLFQIYAPKIINNEITISFPVLVKAYLSSENEKDAVPVDVIELSNKSDTTALALLPGNSYKIIIGNKQKQKQILNLNL